MKEAQCTDRGEWMKFAKACGVVQEPTRPLSTAEIKTWAAACKGRTPGRGKPGAQMPAIAKILGAHRKPKGIPPPAIEKDKKRGEDKKRHGRS
jgi:hypothetical protein